MDLADQIDDYICSFEGIGDLTMDSLAMFIFIWAVLALFLVWLCKFLYNKYVVNNNKTPTSQTNSRQSSVAPGAAATAKNEASKRLSEPREVMASKADFKDLAAKPGGGGARGRAPSGGAGGAAGGAGARRRMVRQGSTGPESRKKRYVPPPSNVVGPETTSVTWTSQVFRWLYSDLVIVNELLTSWVIALNETLKKSMEEHGVAVEVVRVLPDSPPPSLNNIFCNCDEMNPSNMLITFDCDAQPVLQVKTLRQKAGKVDTSHYKVTVSRFRARMATAMNYNTLKGEMKVDGYPDIRVAMNSVGAIKPMDQDEQQLQGVISEIITATLRDSVYPVDFSVYATCPRAEVDPLDMPVIYPVNYDGLAQNMEGSNFSALQPMISGRRLLVKIVKGEGLADAKDPFVVVEMDEPAQKNQTGARQGATPYWDEHFLFELSPQSAEILFEVYDRPDKGVEAPRFLGLGLVGIDELAVGPASTQVLTLQPRPYETSPVSGTITVDFVFIEGAEIPAGPKPYKLKEALKISTPIINEHMKNGAGLADAAVRALQDGALSTTGQPSKSTLIIHSVQRNQNNSNAFKVEINKEGRIEVKESPQEELDGAVTQILESPLNDNTSESLPTANTTADIEQIQQEISVATDITASPTDSCPPNDVSLDESGVASGNSSALVASSSEFGQPNAASSPQGHNGYSPYNGNSTSNGSQTYGYQSNSLPRNGGATGTPLSAADLDERGRKSSAISGFSSASNKTYVHEASTLVLETIENGVKRHFIVPLAIAQRPRWRRKGTKLHIYNDHTFIAKHLSGGGLQCQVCMKSIPRRPGKQGYECRDCNLICHKQCHIRAPQACPNPTVLSMELSKLNSAAADRSIRKL
ncbi:uncharacterized protein LOC105213405 isoform X10 [Zeugodacus cucurbitae]|uniref:uncharacterized protein LOC105213405 isoform X10 n=1 Tax=Zeugodacus cucurbitae TaxID=28588 RepID=UPI0023D9560D|nr:uncharacterized protein LOC105213405 isoform X10 [Zeugodacus cucurbitae]